VFFKLVKGILWADVAYTWFADVNAFFIVLFCMFLRKKSLIVVGGYDVVYIPEIDYGTLKSLKNRLRVKFVLEHASKILPFSYYANERVLSITKKANICVIPLSCDVEKFKPINGRKENLVITVCYVDKGNIARKGLKTFVESAKFLPQLKFALIGSYVDDAFNYLKKISTSNVEFTGYISDEELSKWYQKAKVYCQLSYQEGFGVALIEAMACECIPVASLRAKVLRETVGECGYYVPYGDVLATVEAIKKASSAPQHIRGKVRKRAKDFFSIEKREKTLLKLINDIPSAHM
jgi:glycosyltransferase involved in cell wall biosynthesis